MLLQRRIGDRGDQQRFSASGASSGSKACSDPATRSDLQQRALQRSGQHEPLAASAATRSRLAPPAASVSSVVSPATRPSPAEHQELRGELAIDQPAARELHVERVRPPAFSRSIRPRIDATSAASVCPVARLGRRARRARSTRARISSASPAIGAAARHRHVLPGPRLVQLIVLERLDMRGERPRPAGRPQPEVDLVGDALRGRRGKRRDEPLRQPGVVLRGGERPLAVGGTASGA